MRESNRILIFLIFAAINALLFVLGYNDTSLNLMMVATLLMFVTTLGYSLSYGNKMIIFTAFLICFFTFVLGEWGVCFMVGQPWGTEFDRVTIKHVLLCVYLSITSIFAGAMIGNLKSEKKQKTVDFKAYQEANAKFEGTIRILLYITMIFSVLDIGNKIIFVMRNSYIDLYTTSGYSMPYMVQKLSACSTFLFFSYLAILPEKKKAKKPIFLYSAIHILSILAGSRGDGVKVAIMVFAYCLFRNTVDEEKWVKKKHIILLCIAAPIAIVLLSLYNFWRSGMTAHYYGFWDEFINFFTTQGGSIKIIGYEKQLHSILPETNISYTFGPIINWYKHGFLGNFISMFTGQDFIKYSGNTIGSAMYDNNLGATITYLVMPQNYLSGVGMGTQYIAELYSDFGYAGVIIFNLMLGWFITKCRFVYFKKWYWNAITIGVVHFLFGIGRDFATTFAAYYVSVVNWVTVAAVYGLCRIKLRKHGDLRDENTVGV
ncbi:MAG: O-antigen polysaccharide polymerase Wzy family protein [Clostridia bacterium]|nr:O-antigen polysaccharide polymerase Wzy family protein [Clostridia bacterium]